MTNNETQRKESRKTLTERLLNIVQAPYTKPLISVGISIGLLGLASNQNRHSDAELILYNLGGVGVLLSSIWIYGTKMDLIDKREIEIDKRLKELEIEEKNKPKFIYQFKTEPTQLDLALAWKNNLESIALEYKSHISEYYFNTLSVKSRKNKGCVSGIVIVKTQDYAKQIMNTIESFIPMQKKVVTYEGKNLENNL